MPDKDTFIANLIIDCQKQTKQTYGYRRVKIWLLRETRLVINHKAVLRIMRKYNLLSEIRKPRPLYQRQAQFKVYEDKIKRDFTASKPNQKWVTDISYIHTKQGTLYLSMIKDLYDNYIVSYDMATVQDNSLVYRTIKKAEKKLMDKPILHSDQGFQYTSRGYMKYAEKYSIKPSMSRAGTPLDNAPAEQFFSVLKTECIYRNKIDTFDQAKKLIDEYIYFYNYERIQIKTQSTPYEIRCKSA